MRKQKLKLVIVFLLFLSPKIIWAERIDARVPYGTYDKARELVKEGMKSYYLRGPSIQYNYSKATYGEEAPEEATSQDTKYAVCAAYTYDVYTETFGVKYDRNSSTNYYHQDKSPIDTGSILGTAREYCIEANCFDTANRDERKLNGNFLIYYQNGDNKYVYGDSDDIFDLIELIQPGDIFIYTGHAMIAYDIINRSNKHDVLMLNATRINYIQTRIAESTPKISYDAGKSTTPVGFVNLSAEGTVQQFDLRRDEELLVHDGKIECGYGNTSITQCAIIRPYYDDNGTAVFNYSIDTDKYNKSLLRLNYPGLYIEKTIDVGDNNSVNLDDELEYTIKITNRSDLKIDNRSESSNDDSGFAYDKFYIEEEVSDLVDYIRGSATVNNGVTGEYNEDNNTIKWAINGLASGDTVLLKYSVQVKNEIENVNKVIISNGKFYKDNNSYITTGTVENTIVARAYETLSGNDLKTCYNNNKGSKTGLDLINEIYNKCYSDKTINFTNFSFQDIFGKAVYPTEKGFDDAIYVKENLNDNGQTFYKMILNNYWSGLVVYRISGTYKFSLPKWRDSTMGAQLRAKTINPTDFKDGDILIYYIAKGSQPNTDSIYSGEIGTYAYIYINGEFVGNNPADNSGETIARNSYTFSHYANLYSTDAKLQSYFYKGYTSSLSDDIKEFINYQHLYDKDYYVILRPSQLTNVSLEVDNSVKIDNENKIVYRLDSNLNNESLKGKITNKYVDVTNNSSDQILKTGDVVNIKFGIESATLDYRLSVKGDILETGIPSIDDVREIFKQIIDGNVITREENIKAADYNDDSIIKANDAIKLLADLKNNI